MGVQIIQDHINAVSVGIQDIHEIAHGESKFAFGATAGDKGMALSSFGFSKDKHVARAVALIFMVLPAWVTRSHGKRWARLFEQLETLLIETDHGSLGVIGLVIQTQYTFHLRQEQRRNLGDAPAFYLPRLNLFFSRMRRTVSGAICSITPSSTKRWAKSSSVHRARPSVGWEHAKAVSFLSCISPTLPPPPLPALSVRATSSPSSQKRNRVRRTVSSAT